MRVTAVFSWFEKIVSMQPQGFDWVFSLKVQFLLAAGCTISKSRRRLWIDSTKQSLCSKTSVSMGRAQSRRPWRMSKTAMLSLMRLWV